MNVLVWILQVALGLLCFAGGSYKVFNYSELAAVPQTGALPHAAWTALGVFEMLCAVLLILPAVVKRLRSIAPLAAAALAVENLALAGIFARYSLAVVATNPLVWTVAIALVAAIVAFGRFSLRPAAV